MVVELRMHKTAVVNHTIAVLHPIKLCCMCSKLTEGNMKNCSCKLAHLCKRNRISETVQGTVQPGLNKQATLNPILLPFTFNQALANRHIHAQEGNHI